MKTRSYKKASRPLLAFMGFVLFLSMAVIFPGNASVGAQDFDQSFSALLDEIVSRFPDRKTSSYESSRFLSFASACLAEHGWEPSLEDYGAVMKSSEKNGQETLYVCVTGQNLTAQKPGASPDVIDLLIIAPYDTVISDDAQFPLSRPYTAEASAALLRLASELEETRGPSIALALVSGHYQLGAGTEALLESFASKGAHIKMVLVLADMYSSRYLPVVPNSLVNNETIRAADNAVRKAGLRSHVARPNDSTWYETAASGPPGTSVESVLGVGFSSQENNVLEANGIPSITVGFPRGDRLLTGNPLTLEGPDPRRTTDVSSALLAMIDGILPMESGEDQMAAKGMVFFQHTDGLIMLPRKTVLAIGLVAVMVGGLILALYRRLLSPHNLALLGGIALAGVVAFGTRWAVFSSSTGAYAGFTFPVRSVLVWLLIFVGLILLGFLQMWNVKTRIAHLPKRAVEEPQPVSGRHEPTAGSWGLAVMLAVTAGTSLLGSPYFPYSMCATLAMMIAVIIEGEPARRGRSLGLLVWVNRTLYLVPLFSAILWAGPPNERETMAHLASTVSKASPEALVSLLSIATSASSFISTLRLPKPASKGKRSLLVAAIVATLLGVFIGTYALAKIPVDSLLAVAVAHESYGDFPTLTMVTPRALNGLTTVPWGLHEGFEHYDPRFLTDRNGSMFASLPPISTLNLATTEVIKIIPPEANTPGESTSSLQDVPSEILVRATLAERPTLLTLEIRDTPMTRAGSAPQKLTEIIGIDSLLKAASSEEGMAEPDGLSEGSEGFAIPRNGGVRIIWWYPPEQVFSKQFELALTGKTRVDISLLALYPGRSHLGLTLQSPGAYIISVTSVTKLISIR